MTGRGVGVAVGLAGVLLVASYVQGKHDGGATQREKAAEARVDTLTIVSRKTDTLYVREKAKLGPVIHVWDSVRVRDTITVEVPGKADSVIVYVPRAPADSAIASCLRVVSACELRHSADSSLVSALRLQVKAVQANRPGFFRRWAERALYFGAGFGVASVVR